MKTLKKFLLISLTAVIFAFLPVTQPINSPETRLLIYGESGAAVYCNSPFYGKRDPQFVLRAEFSTDYSKSSAERKHNVELAAKRLNNAFIDVNAEFSFNRRVGARTAARGYKNAKIIVKGKFVDGIGGGVCQVSTTLYNAALLAGLKVTEKHAHSLAVSYVKPSFDAMVSGGADLKFANTTGSPLFIKTIADGEKLSVFIYGEKLNGSILLKSVIKEYIPASVERVKDEKHDYPDLKQGEEKLISYGKQGIKSVGYLIMVKNGKKSSVLIRKDVYSPINGIIVLGTAKGGDDTLFTDHTAGY